jgi:hypothetical protein
MRSGLLFFISTVSIFISCQQEPDEILEQIQQRGCRIDTGIYFGGGGFPYDSAYFSYSNDKIMKVEGFDNYVNYTYAGNQINTRRWFEKPDNRLYQIDSILYNTQNRIQTMVTWYYDHPIYWDTIRTQYNFEYTSGRLTAVNETSILFSTLGNMYDTMRSVFVYNGAGNIVKLEGYEPDGTLFEETEYTYNTHPNYFSALHPDFFLLDPFFQIHAGFIPHLPYFYSTNNVISFDPYGGIPYEVSYGVDSLNNVTSVDVDGSEYMKYRFRCN